jgi:hypothetical protein
LAADEPAALRFTPKDRRLLIASGSMVEPWFWDPRQKLLEACARATRNLTPDEWRTWLPEASYSATCENPSLLKKLPQEWLSSHGERDR